MPYHLSWMPKIGFILLIITLVSCEQAPTINHHDDLVQFFNQKGRYARFSNSTLIFGDTLPPSARTLLGLDATINTERIYRKAAYQKMNDDDSAGMTYYMYGVSRQDSLVDEVRIRSFLQDSMIGDFLIIDLARKPEISYDYWIMEPRLIVQARNNDEDTHYSFFIFKQGQMVSNTFVPDTIFRRQDLAPDLGRTVRIYDNFQDYSLSINGQKTSVSGKIVDWFWWEDCSKYMLIDLGDQEILEYPCLMVNFGINITSPVYGLLDHMLFPGEIACERPAATPASSPVLLKEKSYIDYQ